MYCTYVHVSFYNDTNEYFECEGERTPLPKRERERDGAQKPDNPAGKKPTVNPKIGTT